MPANPFKFNYKIIVFLGFILIFALLFFLKQNKKTPLVSEHAVAVRVQVPSYGNLEKDLRLNGYVESDQMITITPKVSGQVDKIFVEVGQKVHANQVIAQIDSEPMLLTLKQAEVAYLAGKSTYERISKLYKANATTKQNYDQAKSQYDAYQSQYELAKLQYNYSKIKTPIDGVVLIRHLSAGSMADTRTPIITVANLNKLILRSKIPDKYYQVFTEHKKDMKIIVTQPDSGHVHTVKIRTIAPYISAETKNFEIICDFTDSVSDLRPGMFVYIDFTLESRNNLYYLPFQTLVSGNQLWYLDKNDKTRKTNLTPSFYNSDFFEVPETFKNTRFIVEGQFFVREHQTVNILTEEDHQ